MDGNDKIARFVQETNWVDLPVEVQRRASICLLDNLGVTLAGTVTPVSRIASEYASAAWSGSTATILLHNRRATAPGAAFANANAANSLDLDDDAVFTRGHPGAQIFPAALSVAEKMGASGAELLEAMVVGYEVAIRVGRCWHDHYNKIHQACGSWGSVACAAVASRLMGMDRSQIKHALGIAEYHSPNAPMMRSVSNPSMVKHAIGWGAMNGVTSAELAALGFTGIPSLPGFEQYESWLSDLGIKYWMTDGVVYKNWTSCAWGHAPGAAVMMLLEKNRIDFNEISCVKVRTFDEAVELYQDYPETTEEAQFSVKWTLACLIIDRQLGPTQILEKRFADPRLRALFDKIELELDPFCSQSYRERRGDNTMFSGVEITLKDGSTLDSGIVGRDVNPGDEKSLESKFRRLASHVLDSATVERLFQMVREFDQLSDVRDMTKLLS